MPTWHSLTCPCSGIFGRLFPLAKSHNVRVVLVNCRDYPGARPYTQEERDLLSLMTPEGTESTAEIAEAAKKLDTFLKERARELFDLLVELVQDGRVAPVQLADNAGGIVVAGWSFGCIWMTALLAHVAAFIGEGLDLSAYVRRVVIFGEHQLSIIEFSEGETHTNIVP